MEKETDSAEAMRTSSHSRPTPNLGFNVTYRFEPSRM